MCGTCGCSKPAPKLGRDRDTPTSTATITLEERILASNDAIADRNRAWFARHGIVALNLMSSPGAGKTTLLERTVGTFRGPLPVRVVEADQATAYDADRVRKAGGAAVQINTGATCHLNAAMLSGVIDTYRTPVLLLIENVGNLVCPSLFDLGQASRVVIGSVTEGDDKPHKYPHMYRVADVVVLNKVDLLPHVDFSRERFGNCLAQVNPGARIIEVSARTGAGFDAWHAWLEHISSVRASSERHAEQ